jgi:hypothetical protein
MARAEREEGKTEVLAFPRKDNKMYPEYHFNFGP